MKKHIISIIFLLIQNTCTLDAHQVKIVKVAIFASADNNIAQHFKDSANKLGQYLGANNFGLMLGSGRMGLMKEVANGYISQATSLEEFKNIVLEKHNHDIHPALNAKNIIVVESLHNRLEYFYSTADILLVLPGGFGTLHELIDCMVHNGPNKKPIIIFNIDGFWNDLIRQFQAITSSNPAAFSLMTPLTVFNTLDEGIEFLKAHVS